MNIQLILQHPKCELAFNCISLGFHFPLIKGNGEIIPPSQTFRFESPTRVLILRQIHLKFKVAQGKENLERSQILRHPPCTSAQACAHRGGAELFEGKKQGKVERIAGESGNGHTRFQRDPQSFNCRTICLPDVVMWMSFYLGSKRRVTRPKATPRLCQ